MVSNKESFKPAEEDSIFLIEERLKFLEGPATFLRSEAVTVVPVLNRSSQFLLVT